MVSPAALRLATIAALPAPETVNDSLRLRTHASFWDCTCPAHSVHSSQESFCLCCGCCQPQQPSTSYPIASLEGALRKPRKGAIALIATK